MGATRTLCPIWVGTITSPVRNGVAAVADWAEGVYTYVFRYGEMEAKIKDLEQENADLRQQIRDEEEAPGRMSSCVSC